MLKNLWLVAVTCCLMACDGPISPDPELVKTLPQKVDFNFHIRPILADRCFSCHGPDVAARKGDLRLDDASMVYSLGKNGRKPIEPGKLRKSEVWHRIHNTDPERMMPPPDSKLSLSAYEKALISKWIKQGGTYKKHWAFLPVEKPEWPTVKTPEATTNPIDLFVLAKLEQQQLSFSPVADKERLLRRLSLDLTGLPPSLEEIDDFLSDTSSSAYEKVVDRLLATTAYAERMAQDWMDLARYADSQGLHSDGWRSMYPWRDWVISAFKENMPYDRFLTWQLAGDLLPNPSRAQIVATGFNRNHKTSAEGGIVDEEYRMEYVHDRVATTATAFLGLTMECARCHDHKYDPISQKDYYRFFAFFNQVDELGMTGDDGNSGPNLLLPSPATAALIGQLQLQIAEKQTELALSEKALAEQRDFLTQLKKGNPAPPDLYLPFDQLKASTLDGQPAAQISGEVALEMTERGMAIVLDGEYEYISIKQAGLFDQNQAFAASIWVNPGKRSSSQTIMGNTGSKGVFWRGWDFILDSLNRPSLRLIHALPHDLIQVRIHDSIPVNQWTHLAFSYDGMGKAKGIQLYVNGEQKVSVVLYDQLERSIYPMAFSKEKTDTPLRLGKSYRGFTGEYGIYSGMLDEFRLYSRVLSALEVSALAGGPGVASVAQEASDATRKGLFDTWRAQQQLPAKAAIAALRKQQMDLLDTVPEVMVMKDLPQSRPTFLLNRGNYNEPAMEVTPGMPAKIFPLQDSLNKNRLALVKWLLDPKHPLTSRVAVNRFWQQLFGRGLVDTPHDFGLQGSLPSHPQLLDWLAASFVESGWDIKALLKTIVLSKTYRQSSALSPILLEKDPQNVLLARGPSYRLPAETIRDNALAASGLLYRKIGGPSVKPIQPDGLWKEKTSSTHLLRQYEADTGTAQYRRSLYTFVRRTSPHPAMTAFDAPNRSVCTAQRQLTNTPMQALVLLNDPQFIEASRALAQWAIADSPSLPVQITGIFRRLTSRQPTEVQISQLTALFEEEQHRFQQNPGSAEQLLAVGAYPIANKREAASLAALTIVSNTIMNFDDCYTKR
ncbi:MAG: DUF1553 domain-containing protein [Saprospiraceae bacterium]